MIRKTSLPILVGDIPLLLFIEDGGKTCSILKKRTVFVSIIVMGLMIAGNVLSSTTAVFNNIIDDDTSDQWQKQQHHHQQQEVKPQQPLRQQLDDQRKLPTSQSVSEQQQQQQQPHRGQHGQWQQQHHHQQQQELTPQQPLQQLDDQHELPTSQSIHKQQQQQQHPHRIQEGQGQLRLEFVHIPKTGGTAIEQVAWNSKYKIPWGAYHYNRNNQRQLFQRRFLNVVPYWHMPPQYYQRNHHINMNDASIMKKKYNVASAILQEFDPHGPSPYINAILFTVVRNPYARAVSEYLFYHRDAKHLSIEFYTNAHQLNHWLSIILQGMEDALRAPNASSEYTIDTAGHWNKPYEMNRKFCKYYFHTLGHFIPQYDYVYDKSLDTILHNDDLEERLPPPPQPVIQHVLHFENLHEEFATLMKLYHLEHVVLPNNPHHDNMQQQSTKANEISTTAEGISDNEPSTKPISIVGVANLTKSTRRLIEKVYARDFAAFGYEMIQ